jgi:hypothetical protein
MRSSHIVAVDPAHLTDAPSGFVVLGHLDGLAYCHVAPTREVVRLAGGRIEGGQIQYDRILGPDEPDEDLMLVVGERGPLPWGDKATVIFDPTPEPFAWADFAKAHPDLAAERGVDKEGNPVPPVLTPHGWAGE